MFDGSLEIYPVTSMVGKIGYDSSDCVSKVSPLKSPNGVRKITDFFGKPVVSTKFGLSSTSLQPSIQPISNLDQQHDRDSVIHEDEEEEGPTTWEELEAFDDVDSDNGDDAEGGGVGVDRTNPPQSNHSKCDFSSQQRATKRPLEEPHLQGPEDEDQRIRRRKLGVFFFFRISF